MPTWGRLLSDAKDYLDLPPHWALFPGLMVFLVVIFITYIGMACGMLLTLGRYYEPLFW